MDPFIRVIIGGSYYQEIRSRNGFQSFDNLGKIGVMHNTDVIKFLEPGQSKFCRRRPIETIYEASYFQLEQERLHIQVWDLENYKLNRFIAYNSIPLSEIVDGPMQ